MKMQNVLKRYITSEWGFEKLSSIHPDLIRLEKEVVKAVLAEREKYFTIKYTSRRNDYPTSMDIAAISREDAIRKFKQTDEYKHDCKDIHADFSTKAVLADGMQSEKWRSEAVALIKKYGFEKASQSDEFLHLCDKIAAITGLPVNGIIREIKANPFN